MIKTLDFKKYKINNKNLIKNFLIDKNIKTDLGIVYTPLSLIKKIIDLIPENEFKENKKFLDIGAGLGNFSFIIYEKIFNNNKNINYKEDSIIKNNLYLSEVQEDQINYLKELFGKEINLFKNFFLIDDNYLEYFDIIVGNPPYNFGSIKTPTNTIIEKKFDGKTVWQKFVFRSIELLKSEGYLSLIIPAIWLKPDKSGIYDLLTSFRIIKLNTLNNSETNKEFNYQAQTPTCYFLIQKKLVIENTISIYDSYEKEYIDYKLLKNYCIPMNAIFIINKLFRLTKTYGNINVYKSNTISRKINLSITQNEFYNFKNISSCILKGKYKEEPELVEFHTDQACHYYGEKKLILAHKMYGFPYLDYKGIYGICTRDNYIIKDYSIKELENIGKFLSTKIILFIYQATSYRMSYLEKYIFSFIPNINKIKELENLPDEIIKREEIIYKFLNLSENQILYINNNIKNYNFFM
jgi:SAM-dependent methyltransferase